MLAMWSAAYAFYGDRRRNDAHSRNCRLGAGKQRDVYLSDHGGRQISVNMDIKLLHLDDESLICRIQEGSHEAFATLVDRHSNRFYRIAYRLVSSKDDAEDIVQEAFLKLWDRPNLWDPGKASQIHHLVLSGSHKPVF